MKEYIIPIIETKKGSILTVKVSAIVNPTNSFGFMGSGLSFLMKEVGGQEIEDAAIEQAPIQVGEAIVTTGGMLPTAEVIHAPTMHDPASKIDAYDIECAMIATLEIADKNKFRDIAIPGFCSNNFSKKECAKTMINCIKRATFEHVEKITLIDIDEEMVEEFNKALKLYGKKK